MICFIFKTMSQMVTYYVCLVLLFSRSFAARYIVVFPFYATMIHIRNEQKPITEPVCSTTYGISETLLYLP